jgi:ferredoxin
MPVRRPVAKVRGVFEVRIHGRGGQGVVTSAELLALAAFLEGRHAQAFPSLDFCKGCGLCAAECPCGAIEMEPEKI